MARRLVHDGPVNTAVMAWMRGQGIKPDDVRGYTLTYDAGDVMRIDIRMHMEDAAPKSANPSFVADSSGDIWRFDLAADGYRFSGGKVRSLDYVRERYGIASVQPKHATCIITTGPDGPIAYACSAECPRAWPNEIGAHTVIAEFQPREYCPNCVERCESDHGPCLTESGECAADS